MALSRLFSSRKEARSSACPPFSKLSAFFFFFFTLSTSPRRSLSLKLSKTRVYEPQIRARLITTAHFFEAVILKLRAVPVKYNSQCCGLTDCGKCLPHRLRGSAALAGPHRVRVESLTCAVHGGRCWGSSVLRPIEPLQPNPARVLFRVQRYLAYKKPHLP